MSGLSVIEHLVRSKIGDPDRGDDRILVGDDIVAVIDGVSRRPGDTFDGAVAADIVAEVLASSSGATLGDVVSTITRRIADISCGSVAPGAVFAAVVASRREVWRVGDPNVRIDGVTFGGATAPDAVSTTARAFLETTRCGDPSAIAIELSGAQRKLANRLTVGGYAVLDGTTVPSDFLEVWALDNREHRIVLTTDGYGTVFDDLDRTEARRVYDRERDPLGVLANLHYGKDLLAGAEAFDDRGFVSVILGEATREPS